MIPRSKQYSIAREAAPNRTVDSIPVSPACMSILQSKYPKGEPQSSGAAEQYDGTCKYEMLKGKGKDMMNILRLVSYLNF